MKIFKLICLILTFSIAIQSSFILGNNNLFEQKELISTPKTALQNTIPILQELAQKKIPTVKPIFTGSWLTSKTLWYSIISAGIFTIAVALVIKWYKKNKAKNLGAKNLRDNIKKQIEDLKRVEDLERVEYLEREKKSLKEIEDKTSELETSNAKEKRLLEANKLLETKIEQIKKEDENERREKEELLSTQKQPMQPTIQPTMQPNQQPFDKPKPPSQPAKIYQTTGGILPYVVEKTSEQETKVYFLQGRESSGTHKNTWTDFGGLADKGESSEQAAAREGYEETMGILSRDYIISKIPGSKKIYNSNFIINITDMVGQNPDKKARKEFIKKLKAKRVELLKDSGTKQELLEKDDFRWIEKNRLIDAVNSQKNDLRKTMLKAYIKHILVIQSIN